MPTYKISLFIDESPPSDHFGPTADIFGPQLTISGQPLFQEAPIVHRTETDSYTIFFCRYFLETAFGSPNTSLNFCNIPHRQQYPPKYILLQPP